MKPRGMSSNEISPCGCYNSRFRNVYRACQNEMSRLRKESDESKKKSAEDICKNVLAMIQVIMREQIDIDDIAQNRP